MKDFFEPHLLPFTPSPPYPRLQMLSTATTGDSLVLKVIMVDGNVCHSLTMEQVGWNRKMPAITEEMGSRREHGDLKSSDIMRNLTRTQHRVFQTCRSSGTLRAFSKIIDFSPLPWRVYLQ